MLRNVWVPWITQSWRYQLPKFVTFFCDTRYMMINAWSQMKIFLTKINYPNFKGNHGIHKARNIDVFMAAKFGDLCKLLYSYATKCQGGHFDHAISSYLDLPTWSRPCFNFLIRLSWLIQRSAYLSGLINRPRFPRPLTLRSGSTTNGISSFSFESHTVLCTQF